MRIGVEVSSLAVQRTGVGHYLARLLRALLDRDDGHEYVLFCHRPLDRDDPCLRGARFDRSHFQPSRWAWMQTVLPRALARACVDVCHFTNSLAPIWQPAPGVLLIHDASVFLFPRYHTFLRRMGRSTLVPTVARRAAAVVTVSQAARGDLVEVLGLPADRVHVVYGAAPPTFAPVHDARVLDAVRRKYSLPNDFVLAVGTLEPRKNLARLVRAHVRLRRAGHPHGLVLVGPAGWRMQELDREVSVATDAVHALGYVPTEDLPALYSLASVFAYPSLYEGFGLPAIEAMTCGAPVLAGNPPALVEVCGDAAYLVDPTDEDALIGGLAALLSHDALREKLRVRGFERARRFSWKRSADQMLAVYEAVAEEPVSETRLSR